MRKAVVIFIVLFGALVGIPLVNYPVKTHAQGSNRAISPEETSPSPTFITEPILLEAWRFLYDQKETFLLWEGSSYSGETLARIILDYHVQVVWDWANICKGDSCSPQYRIGNSIADCMKYTCIDKAGYPARVTIYINSFKSDIPDIAGTMAHEVFHQLHPFGNVPVTRYEEYWAYAVYKRLARSDWPSYTGEDPLNPEQLTRWFDRNDISGYDDLALYPTGFPGP